MATPTPWTSGSGPGIPFPTTISLQGIIEETPGVGRVTNGVILRVQ